MNKDGMEPKSDDGATDTTGRAEELHNAHDEDVGEKHVEAVGFAIVFHHAAHFPEATALHQRAGRRRRHRRVHPSGQAAAIGKNLHQRPNGEFNWLFTQSNELITVVSSSVVFLILQPAWQAEKKFIVPSSEHTGLKRLGWQLQFSLQLMLNIW